MVKIPFYIPIPTFIESIIVYFLLRYRKKHYGFAFRRIKLITDKNTDGKHRSAGRKPAETRYTIVDQDDYQKLAEYNWLLWENKGRSCAVRYRDNKIIYMHRVIMNAPPGKIVDHRNRESLDNTRRNLRFATSSQNNCNKKTGKKGSSKYRGVHFAKDKGKRNWRAEINYNGMHKHLGYFDNEEDAARAYDEAAKIYHGEFAVLNFE